MSETKKPASRGIYQGLDRSDTVLSAVLVQSGNKWFRFKLWADRVMIVSRTEEYNNFQEFSKYAVSENDIQEARNLYHRYFDKFPPKNAKVAQIAEAVWCKLYAISEDRETAYTTGGGRDIVTGKKKRKRNLDGRLYSFPNQTAEEAANIQNRLAQLPPQAKVCLKVFQKELSDSEKVTLNEAEIKDMMTRARDRGDLKTKQDPFRIWQYYRPALVEANLLKHD